MSTVIPFLQTRPSTKPDLTTIKDLSDIDTYIVPSEDIDEFGKIVTSPHEFRVVRFNTTEDIGSLTPFEKGLVNLIGYVSTCIQGEMDKIFKEVPTFKLRMCSELLNSKHLAEVSARTRVSI